MTPPAFPRVREVVCGPRARAAVLAGAFALAVAVAGGAETGLDAARPLLFHRVFVPAGRLDDVPLGDHRLVPMAIEDFEEALRGIASGNAPAPGAGLLAEARYKAILSPDGRIAGRVAFDVPEGGLPRDVALGTLPIEMESAGDAEGPGGILLHGHRSLGVVATVWRAGPVAFPFALSPGSGDRYELPLVPAARGTVELILPSDRVPLPEGSRWVGRAEERPAESAATSSALSPMTTWSIDVGPLDRLVLRLLPRRQSPQALSCWQSVDVGVGEVRLVARIVPAAPWRSREVLLDADPGLVPEGVTIADTGDGVGGDARRSQDGEGRTLAITIPEVALGTTSPILLEARAPRPAPASDARAPWLPLVWPGAAEWAGGGVRVTCEPGLSLVGFEVEDGTAVSETVAASWPLPATGPERAGVNVAVEAHGHGARVRAAVLPAAPDLDIARVTTVDVSAATVVGIAVCDLRVGRGSAFDVSARIGAGWFIDAVEALETVEGGAKGIGGPPVPIEWRVVRDDRGALLRVGLATAATPSRGLTLRITGHRAGVGAETPFTCREMDMVRLEGERDDAAMLVLTSSPETTIELEGDAPAPERLPERLARLATTAPIRAWIPAESPLLAGIAMLRERRGAVEGTTRVVLTCREDRITQAFTFVCRPGPTPLDAVVVHFSEPTDELLEWALLPAAEATLAVRRMSSPRGRDSGGESWLVEFSPPLRGETGLRASRVVPFNGPVTVPLSWIEGDEQEEGNLVVVNAGRRRPSIVNRRLTELPPSASAGEPSARGVVAEFGYSAADALPRTPPAAEIQPGGRDRDEEARAWAWNERSTCWIHPTGVTEYETRYDLENHGRATVALAVPEGVVPRGVTLDGAPASAADARGGVLVVDLPPDKRFVRVAVRTEAEVRTRRSGWRVPLASTAIDTPVLERSWRVLVPDGVEVLRVSPGLREVAGAEPGWVERLLQVSPRRGVESTDPGRASTSRSGTIDAGFRERSFVQPTTGIAPPSVLLVHSTTLWGATLLVCLTFAAFGVGARRRFARLGVAIVLAVLTQWVPPPLDGLARAGLWGLAAAAALRSVARSWRAGASIAASAVLCATIPTAGAAPPATESLPVFIVPSAPGPAGESGGTALVPEPIFRALAFATGRRAGDGVRVLAARLEARPRVDGPWHLEVDIDADPGSLLSLEQDGDAVWTGAAPLVDGATVRPTADSGPRVIRVGFATGGRHTVRLPLTVTPTPGGDLESARVSMPPAPRSTVFVEGALVPARGAPASIQIDRPDDRGHPRTVRPDDRDSASGAFDVGRATWVRLVWAVDGRTALADGVPIAESRNDVAWRDGGCRVAASYDIDGRGQIVRAVVVRADPRLGAPALSDPTLVTTDLGGGRHLVTRLSPGRGRFAFVASFPIGIADPVGTFDLPGAWLESTGTDVRTVRVLPSADLSLRATPPEDATAATVRGDDANAAEGAGWRVEIGRGSRSPESEGANPSAAILPRRAFAEGNGRIVVERRRVPPRGTQRVGVAFDRDQVRVRLEARIDAARTPLVVVPIAVPAGCSVERAALREEPGPGVVAATAEPVDVRWHRDAPERLLAVAQRPRAGIFSLEVVAVIDGAPVPRGTLPMVRTLLEASGPATVTWTAPRGTAVEIDSRATSSARATPTGSIDVGADAAAPAYRLVDAEAGESDSEGNGGVNGAPDAAPAAAVAEDLPGAEGAREPRVELTETHLAIDLRGRAWGVSRFDLVADDPVVRVRVPAGMRLYEVFVDGRVAAEAVPSRRDREDGDETWEVRLLDVRWPRSVVAVYAGEIERALADGATLSIDAAAVLGLPCRRWAWVIEHPRGVSLLPAAPARSIDAAGLAEVRGQALDGIAPAFASAIASTPLGDELRLEEYLARRRQDALLPLPSVWAHPGERPGERGPGWAAAVRIVEEGGDERPILRLDVAGNRDATLPGRVWATASLLACFAALWETRRRTPAFVRRASALVSTWWALPTALVLGGAAWVTALDPAWPGWAAVACGALALVARAPPRWRRAGPARRPRLMSRAATSGSTRVAGPVPPDAVGTPPLGPRRTGEDGSTGSTVRRP